MSTRSSSPQAACAVGPVSPVAETTPAISWDAGPCHPTSAAAAGSCHPTSAAAGSCPSESVILALWEGRLAGSDRGHVEDHLALCVPCRELVSVLAPPSSQRSGLRVAPAAPVQVGEVVADKYEIERTIGQGGMGWVVRAHHRVLGRPVALKFLLPSVAHQPEALVRFFREARAAAMIDSEHVVRVLDAGRMASSGTPFLVMEYLEGTDLSALVRDRGPLPLDDALEYARQACSALSLAHARGIVHRDVKPANLFLVHRDGRPVVKVLDFGIAKMAEPVGSSTDGGLTAAAAIMGSPRYMAPEQMESSRTVDARADVWAMGVVLYELLTGQLPFDGASLPAICTAILSNEPKSVRSVRPEVGAAVDALVRACLEKDPGMRLPSMDALLARIDAVRAHAGDGSITTDRTLPSAPPALAAAASAPTSAEVAVVSAPARRRPAVVIAAVVAIVALGSAAASAWSLRDTAHTEAETATAASHPADVEEVAPPVATSPAGSAARGADPDPPRIEAPPASPTAVGVVPATGTGGRGARTSPPRPSSSGAAAPTTGRPAQTVAATAPAPAAVTATEQPAAAGDVRRSGLIDRN